MIIKLVDYSVLTLARRRDIIIKSPRENAENSESAGAAWDTRSNATTKKSQKNFKKVLTKKSFCDIILKLSQKGQNKQHLEN